MRGAIMATIATTLLACPAAPRAADAAAWAVSPAAPGPDAPPAGRSLFDFMVTREAGGKRVYDLPFPFAALVQRVAERAGCAGREPCVKQVLIPLGRSLQRTAASPEFFRHPRVVAAIDGEGARSGAPLAKDRLYLGYQEQSNVVEVISWNEAAGRFEFQIVRDYRAGSAPQVVYARRAVCAACHQNLAPIFSRQVWEETNANPRVAAAISAAHGAPTLHGVPVRRGVDIPNAIDEATERANLYGITQFLWREACGSGTPGARCRAAATAAALQYRLSGDRAFDESSAEWRDGFRALFARTWTARWPAGLAIPNPDVPNRDPLPPEDAPAATRPTGLALAHVPARFEALAPRPPLETWPAGSAATTRRFVAGLAGHIADADVRALDDGLAARGTAATRRYEAPCEVAWSGATLRFECVGADAASMRLAGRVALAGGRVLSGDVAAAVAAEAEPLQQLEVKSGAFDPGAGRLAIGLATRGLNARLADGAAITGIELRWRPGETTRRGATREVAATATLSTRDDFAAVREALSALAADERGAFGAQPFGRARVLPALFARLGLPAREWCCDDATGLPPVAVEPSEPALPVSGPAQAFAAFYPACASCHATAEVAPPNFLAGPGERVAAAVRHCAPRIYVRLALWRVAPDAREKTPMPPPSPSIRADLHAPPAVVAGLERAAAALVRAETGAEPQLERLLADGYEQLRPCLPG
jgi:mono/diheme cytochrome c family protein